MNGWLIAAAVLLYALVPCAVVVLRGDPMERLVGFEAAGMFAALILMVMAQGYRRDFLMDIALTLALLSFGSGLVYVRFLERWL